MVYLIAGFVLLALLYLIGRSVWGLISKRHPLVVIDGSNVIHWGEGPPQIDYVTQAAKLLRAEGFAIHVIFDANAGYKLGNGYMSEEKLAKAARISPAEVSVVPKGEAADPKILAMARSRRAMILSNDRYRDHADKYPDCTDEARLIRGGTRQGKVWLRQR